MARSRWLPLLLLALLPAPAALCLEIAGQARLISARSGRPARGVDLSELVVAFVPDSAAEIEPPAAPARMATAKKSFLPSSLVIEAGTTVVFPNLDPILHNVFSLTPETTFDLGLYGRGEGRSIKFESPGLVRVFCNVHHDMAGYVFVVRGPFFGRAGDDGSFRLTGLPPGPGLLLAWHPRADILSVPASPGDTISLALKVNRRRIPSHLNKFGKPYRSRRDRYNR